MSTQILTTKFHIPPIRRKFVPRSRLIEQLNDGLDGKLTLISAPAGFGKTTAVSDWIRQSGMSVAWLSLDEGDNDLIRFLTYFITALQRINPGFGETALGILRTSRPPPPDSLITSLINEIAAFSTQQALVLDDYHIIESPHIDQALTFLLDHLPSQIHLIIASRTDPSLPLSRLRAGDQLTELRTADLRFRLDEVTTFLNQMMGLNLSPENIAAVETRTEGWIAGLQLAALSMQGRSAAHITEFINSFTGSNRYIIDYLADEVLQRRPKGTKEFLLQTSILDRLTTPLCDAVIGSPSQLDEKSSQTILETLEAANLFIVPLDDERRWYRYHHLFADLLRSRLEITQPELIPTLHRRASAWYAQNDLMTEAIAHSLAAGDFDQAAQLTEQTFFDRMSRGEDFATMLARLEALPDEIIRARPRLGIMNAWMLAITLQLDAVEPRLQEIERTEGNHLPADLQLQIAEIRAELARFRGDYATAIERSLQVLEALPAERSIADMQTLTGAVFNLAWGYLQTGDVAPAQHWFSEALTISQAADSIHLILLTHRGRAQVHEMRGQLRRAHEVYRQALQLAAEAAQKSGQPVPATVYIHLGLGSLLREWNILDEADSHMSRGLEMGRKWQIGGDTLRDGYLYQAQLKQARGDIAGALDAIRQAQELALAYRSVPGFDDPIAACQAALRLNQAVVTGNLDYLETVEQWAESRGLQVSGSIESLIDEYEYLVGTRLLIAQNKLTPATQMLTRLLQAAEAGGRTGRVIEIWLLQALAQQAAGYIKHALITLERALLRAEPEGYIRLFVNEGEPMEKLLGKFKDKSGRLNAYVNQLLNFFSEANDVYPSSLRPSPGRVLTDQPMVDRLTERELEVLRLLRTNLTGPEIATKLAVSVNTIKTHIKNIYSKLDARSRYEAVDRAKQLDLL